MLGNRLMRLLERFGGMLMRLASKLVRGGAAVLMRGSRSRMRVCSKIVVFSGSVVNALWHGQVLLSKVGCRLDGPEIYRPIHPPSTVTIVPVT